LNLTIVCCSNLELREKAKNELANQFDLKEFYNAILHNSAVPSAILEELIAVFIHTMLETKNSKLHYKDKQQWLHPLH
jgi:hypothetical protein